MSDTPLVAIVSFVQLSGADGVSLRDYLVLHHHWPFAPYTHRALPAVERASRLALDLATALKAQLCPQRDTSESDGGADDRFRRQSHA